MLPQSPHFIFKDNTPLFIELTFKEVKLSLILLVSNREKSLIQYFPSGLITAMLIFVSNTINLTPHKIGISE